MEIRSLQKNDFHKNYINLLKQLTTTDDMTFFSEINFISIFNNLNSRIYIIEDNNTIIASGTLLIEQKFIHNGNKVGHIEDIIVDKNYRGYGLGKKMVKHLIKEAIELNCYKVILDCDESFESFYKKMGFVRKNIQMAKYF